MRRSFYTATALTVLIAFPAFAGIAAITLEIVIVVFGAKWYTSIPIMQMLALAGIPQPIYCFSNNLFGQWQALMVPLVEDV
jgi:O-antigen/teichoic acid export membrane protein